MTTKSVLGPGLLGVLLGLAACTPAAPPVTEAMVQSHVDAATRAAGSDLQQMLALCKPAPAERPRGDDAGLAAPSGSAPGRSPRPTASSWSTPSTPAKKPPS
jgi:hypothetical protein